jgi:two-component sensor histidine kinase
LCLDQAPTLFQASHLSFRRGEGTKKDKDILLKELQHRVKNNLQLITALIRLDARNQPNEDRAKLDRLAGRIEALQLLYRDLTTEGLGQAVDLRAAAPGGLDNQRQAGRAHLATRGAEGPQ